MFNLEEAITGWRRKMLAAGVKAPAPMDELECHLREEIDQQTRSEASAQQAFESAARSIGKATALNAEFEKLDVTTHKRHMIRIIAVLAALFGSVVGGAMVLPALGQWRDRGVLHLGPLLAGSALGIIAGCAVIYGVRTHRGARGRRLISFFIIAAGSFYVVPLILAFFLQRTDLMGWIFCAVLAAASISFYGSCLYFIRNSPAPLIYKS